MINSINPFLKTRYVCLNNNFEYGNREYDNALKFQHKNMNPMDLKKTASLIEVIEEEKKQKEANKIAAKQEENEEREDEFERLAEYYGTQYKKGNNVQTKEADSRKNANQTTQESDAVKTREKDPYSDSAATAAKHYISIQFNRSILSQLTKLTPATIVMLILGIDPEEDGNALKNGALSGKGGNYKQAFKDLIKNYDDALKKAMQEGTWSTIKQGFKTVLGFIPNSGSAIITNTLKHVGSALVKVFDKDTLSALGSGTAVVGKLINTIGNSVANVLGGTFSGIKSLFSGDTKKAGEAFKNIGKKFKDLGVSLKDKIVEFGKDLYKSVTKTPEERRKTLYEKVKNFLKRLGL